MDKQNALTLREVQLGEYEVLKKVVKICEENNFRYFLTYGSMLGAVRHQGIIPWDDDIDIMMPRPDYEKIKKYFLDNEEELKPLKIFDKSVVEKYPHMIIRISDQRYHLIFDNEKDYDIGLFVDIYPIDGVGNDFMAAKKLVKKTKRLASLCFLTGRKSFGVDNTKSIKKMIIKFPAFLWAKLNGNNHYILKLDKLAKTYDYNNSKYVACVAWPPKIYDKEKIVFTKEIMEETIDWKFENSEFKILKKYDEFLSANYGDYMTPPSEKGKKTNHTYKAYKRKEKK
ncbi:MAG: LicD family protein [Clostridia bacterium]|nr:LicD family protein [Clostridia bacterium]